jgi:hypothetical protein
MGKRGTTDELALMVCRELYEFTDGFPMEWRKAVGGGPSMHRVLERAVERGWLLWDLRDGSVCLTDEGRRLVRKTLS